MGLHVAILGGAASMNVKSVKPVVFHYSPLYSALPMARFRAVFGVLMPQNVNFSREKLKNPCIDLHSKQRKDDGRAEDFPETFRANSDRSPVQRPKRRVRLPEQLLTYSFNTFLACPDQQRDRFTDS